MLHLRRSHLFYYFPLISIVSLIFTRMIELDYPTREPQLFREFLYFNVLTPTFYFFLLAYLIPLFISFDFKKNIAVLLKFFCITLYILYITISFYFFFIRKQPDLFSQNIDVILGVLGGTILGVAFTNSKK